MTPYEEAVLDKKIDKHFESQRELPLGRDYLWNRYRYITKKDKDNFRKNFDQTFKDSPGAGICTMATMNSQ